MLSGKLKCTVIDGTDAKIYKTFANSKNYYFLYIIIMWPTGPINHELERKAAAVANVIADKIKGWMYKK